MTRRNPFEYGRELSGEELVDREEELSEIAATIRNRAKLFLIGPRRFGKTSLLSVSHEAAARDGVTVLRLDAEKYETLDLLAGGLLSAATASLKGGAERAMETIRKVATRLRPQISFDGESFHVTLGAERRSEGEVPLLTDALDAVEQLAKESRREVAIILDEVQQIVIEHGLAAERQLRSVVQRHRHVAYIFAGSSTRLLTQMTEDPNRPFYRLGSRLFLGPVPREDFSEFLVRRFRETGLRLTDEAAAAILDLAEEVPYNVQRLAHATWELCTTWPGKDVDLQVVVEALRRIVLRDDPAYTQLWTRLTTNQKKALKAVISTHGVEVLAAEQTRAFRIPASSLRTALEALEEAHVIRVEAELGQSRYRLVDPFLAEWIGVSQAP
ncbi:MAG: AAA family ATPase [Gemmatimonadota bacterium]